MPLTPVHAYRLSTASRGHDACALGCARGTNVSHELNTVCRSFFSSLYIEPDRWCVHIHERCVVHGCRHVGGNDFCCHAVRTCACMQSITRLQCNSYARVCVCSYPSKNNQEVVAYVSEYNIMSQPANCPDSVYVSICCAVCFLFIADLERIHHACHHASHQVHAHEKMLESLPHCPSHI